SRGQEAWYRQGTPARLLPVVCSGRRSQDRPSRQGREPCSPEPVPFRGLRAGGAGTGPDQARSRGGPEAHVPDRQRGRSREDGPEHLRGQPHHGQVARSARTLTRGSTYTREVRLGTWTRT